MPSCVIDISAVFVDLQNDRGAAETRRWLRDAAISSVNLHEIVAKATEKGAAPDQARQIVGELRLTVHAHDADGAFEAGLLRVATKPCANSRPAPTNSTPCAPISTRGRRRPPAGSSWRASTWRT